MGRAVNGVWPMQLTHKHIKYLVVASNVVSAETFSELRQRGACVSENRQFHSGCLPVLISLTKMTTKNIPQQNFLL